MSKALRITGLRKTRGNFTLGPIDLEVDHGIAMGLIGPNGAGKSTLINCILTLLRTNSGEVEVCGKAARANDADWKKPIGFVLSQQGFYERLTVADNLRFIASFYDTWDQKFSDALCKRLTLNVKKKVNQLSLGERVKLALAGALAHRPRLLIMDEPTANLDPIVRAEVMDILADLMSSGDHSILMSTHILADISAVADRLAFLRNGKLVDVVDKDNLEECWRRISYRDVGGKILIPGRVASESDGSLHLVTTNNAAAAFAVLQEHDLEVLDSNRISLEEISVFILKGTKE